MAEEHSTEQNDKDSNSKLEEGEAGPSGDHNKKYDKDEEKDEELPNPVWTGHSLSLETMLLPSLKGVVCGPAELHDDQG